MRKKKKIDLTDIDFTDSRLTKDEVMQKLYGDYEGKFDDVTFTRELFLALQDYFDAELIRFSNAITIRFGNGKKFSITVKETTDKKGK